MIAPNPPQCVMCSATPHTVWHGDEVEITPLVAHCEQCGQAVCEGCKSMHDRLHRAARVQWRVTVVGEPSFTINGSLARLDREITRRGLTGKVLTLQSIKESNNG